MKVRRATLAAALFLALPGCGLLMRTIDRSEREGAARLFPATAADVYFFGELPALAPLLLLDLPLSLVVDVALLPASLFHAIYERRPGPRRQAPRPHPPSPRPDATPPPEAEAAEAAVPDGSEPPQLELGSGQTDGQ